MHKLLLSLTLLFLLLVGPAWADTYQVACPATVVTAIFPMTKTSGQVSPSFANRKGAALINIAANDIYICHANLDNTQLTWSQAAVTDASGNLIQSAATTLLPQLTAPAVCSNTVGYRLQQNMSYFDALSHGQFYCYSPSGGTLSVQVFH